MKIHLGEIMQKLNYTILSIGMAALFLNAGISHATDLKGAGASFPYPIYAKWSEAYKEKTKIGLNYQSIGSGGGITQIKAKTVDFGASDMPLKPEELNSNGLMQFPVLVGGVTPVVNIIGIEDGALKLNGDVLADIYLGKIKKWNDSRIVALNKDLKLPNDSINVVHRSDGSGTTFIFTSYLSKVSPDWKSKVGEGAVVQWPIGAGGKGNEGVTASVEIIKNSIGYVQYAYVLQNKAALKNKIKYTQLKNQNGDFVSPGENSFKAAAAYARWDKAPSFYEVLTDEPGKESWPITGATFILMHKSQDKPDTANEVLKFFDWAFTSGGKMAVDLDYVPLPDNVESLVRAEWKTNIKDVAGKAIWK
jgi:phosphate transport system substrate-binding protein